MPHESLPTKLSVAGSLRTLRAATRRLSSVRSGRTKPVVLSMLVLVGIVGAVTAFSGSSWARAVTRSLFRTTETSSSDTTVVYGPKRFTTPTGSATLGIERFTLVVQPNQEYVLQVDNGAPDGTSRASSLTVDLNGRTVMTLADLGGSRSGKKVVQALTEDTLRVTVQGSAGAYVDVSVLQTADPTFAVFGPHLFIRNTGSPVSETFTISVPSAGAAPFYMSLQNGNTDGTLRAASATILINGVQVLDPSELNPQVGGLRKQVTLQPSNTLEVRISSIPDSRVTLTFSATDIAPPRLTIATPTPRQITRDATVAVTGTVDDETATQVTVNGLTATRSGSSYSATATLSTEGENTIQVSAIDAAGNRTDSSRVVIHDSQPPVIALTSPADNSFTNQATATVAGTVSDITTTTVNVNGVPLTVGSNGAFSGSVTLAEGSNFVTVTGTDQAGNATSVARHVTLDTHPPVIAVSQPVDGSLTKQTTVALSGTVTDATTVTLKVNGVSVTVSAEDGSFSVPSTALTAEGDNVFTFVATDAAGNSTTATRHVTRDTQPPTLTVSSPADNQVTNNASVTVSGSATDASAVTVTVNGTPATRDASGAFSTALTLSEGPATIAVVATDAAGNVSTTTRTRTVDLTPPTLTVTQPSGRVVTKENQATVIGTVSDATAVSLTVNGISTSIGADGSFSTTVPLTADGSAPITLIATDAAGNHTDVSRSVIRDVSPPTVTLTSPTDGFTTKNGTVHVTGTVADATAVSVNVNGVPVVVDPMGAFAIDVPISAEGSNPILVRATDEAGNSSAPTRTVVLDTQAPVIAVTSPADGATVDQTSIAVTGTVQDASTVTVTVNGAPAAVSSGSFTGAASLSEGANSISIVATDLAGNTSTVTRSVTRQPSLLPGERTPSDPSLGAPAIDQMRPYSVSTSTSFLYTGANPIQKGVIPDSIDFVRGAVVRGQLKTRNGDILPGVDVRVANHPEFGWTTTRDNGQFDLVVNGGGTLRLQFSKNGYVPAERQVQPANNNYAFVEDLAMVPLDTFVTHIDFSQPIQVAQGSVVSDERGQRQQALFFAQGTQATMTLPDGTTQPLASLSVRVTEVTVGSNGKAAMPAALPSHTAYTYAAELTVDEANAAGATSVKFSKPVITYLDNFLGIPTGVIVPSGSYDAGIGSWVGEQNGRVIQIASVTNGLADIVVDSTNTPATLSTLQAMGFTDDERRTLATRYEVGKTLWRMPLQHFSKIDFNLKAYLPPSWRFPSIFNNRMFPPDGPCHDPSGSVISCESQALGEDLPLVGVPATLHYESDRALGTQKEALLDLAITGDTVPANLQGIDVSYSVAGHSFFTSFGPESITPRMRFQRNLLTALSTDPYGRALPPGQYEVRGQVSYRYPLLYGFPCSGDLSAWGIYSCAPFASRVIGEFTVPTPWTDTITVWDARATDALGGWTLSTHHTYSPVGHRLFLGYGETRDASPEVYGFQRYAGTGVRGTTGDGGLAARATLSGPGSMAFGADGSVYVADITRVRRISRDGVIQSVGPTFVSIVKIEMGRDGSLFVFDDDGGVNKDVFKIAPDGTTSRILGGGNAQFPDGTLGVNVGISTQSFSGPFAVGPEGEVYFQAFDGIKRLGTDGRVRTIAVPNFNACFASRIENVKVNTINICNTGDGMTVGPDGSLYFVELINGNFNGAVIRRVDADGNLTTFAGGGSSLADGVPARQALLWGPGNAGGTATYLQFGPDGSLYFKDINQIKRIGPDGKVWTVAGVANSDGSGKLGYPLASNFSSNGYQFGVSPGGTLFVSQNFNLFRLGLPFPSMSDSDLAVFSRDGGRAYIFDRMGRHLRTLDGVTGRQLLGFGYDGSGRLLTITDENNDVTRIERDDDGFATGIVGPFGQRTALAIDAQGYLRRVTDAVDQSTALDYHDGGLLASLTTPKQQLHSFAYDSLGRLKRDADPAGGFTTLARSDTSTGYAVTLTTAEGTKRTLTTERPAGVGLQRTFTNKAGLKTVLVSRPDGTVTRTTPDGTIATLVQSPDDRLGSSAPVATLRTTRFPSGQQLTVRSSRNSSTSDATNVFATSSILDSMIVNGNVFTNRYDVTTHTARATSAMGRVSVATFDDKNRLVDSHTGWIATVHRTYDAHGRLKTIGRAGLTVRFDYDSAGRLYQLTDPIGRTTTFEYDSVGRLRKGRWPGGQEVTYSYDSSGKFSAISPSGRSAYTFSYSPVDLIESETAPQLGDTSTITHYRFNKDKQLSTIVRPGGDSVTIRYDSTGRQVGFNYPDDSVTLAYGATSGLLTTVNTKGEGGGLSIGYDGSLLKSYTVTGIAPGSITFSRDANLLISTITIGGQPIAIGYDKDGILTSVGALAFARDAQTGIVTGTTIGNVFSAMSHDTLGILTGDTVHAGGNLLYAYHLEYDSLQRISHRVEKAGGVEVDYRFGYDSTGRLRSVQRDGQLVSTYDYDENGNRLSITTPSGQVTAQYDAQDRLLRYGNATYGYTPAGERRFRAIGLDTTWYGYDALGNLRSVVLPDGRRIDYVIDGFRRRVAKKVNGTIVTRYLYGGHLGPSAELSATGQVTTRYVYGLQSNAPEYMIRGTATYRLLRDEIGSVREVVDVSSGAIVQRLDYDEFGRTVVDSNPGFQPFGYGGGLTDQDHPLIRFGARDYDPEVGAWTSKDPLGLAGGTNLYAFVNADPINHFDETGLQTDWITRGSKICIVAIIIGCKTAVPPPELPPLEPEISAPAPMSSQEYLRQLGESDIPDEMKKMEEAAENWNKEVQEAIGGGKPTPPGIEPPPLEPPPLEPPPFEVPPALEGAPELLGGPELMLLLMVSSQPKDLCSVLPVILTLLLIIA